jgi:2,3-bisphosphoglycerate-dependent phosphoglycerate mutase
MIVEKWPEDLLLFRHGLSGANVRKQLAADARARGETPESAWAFTHQRDMDCELVPLGHQQAYSLGRYAAEKYPPNDVYRASRITLGRDGIVPYPHTHYGMIEVLLVSPYVRTRQTTEDFCRGLGYRPKIVIEERIRELEFGIMDGLNREGVRLKYPDEAARRDRDGKYWYRPPGGENRPDVRMRVHGVIDTLNRDYVGIRMGVMCHSVVVLAFRSLIERWGEEEYMQVDREDDVKNCGWTRYARIRKGNGEYKLVLAEYNIEPPLVEET